MKIFFLACLLLGFSCNPAPICIESHIESRQIPERRVRIGGGMIFHMKTIPAHTEVVEVCDQWLGKSARR